MTKFKEAFELVRNFYSYCDSHSKDMWSNFMDELESAVAKYKTAEKYKSELYRRTDLSDDDRWEIESLEGGVDILFALMYGSSEGITSD